MNPNASIFQRLTALLMMFTMFAPFSAFAAGDGGGSRTKMKALTEDQKISHVLNRLGFGARPGDVARVKAVGLNKYIEQQLNAPATDDANVAARLKNYEVLDMRTTDIFAKYPNPGALLRNLEGGKKGLAAAQETAQNMPIAGQNMPTAAQNMPNAEPNADERKARQEKLRAYYEEYNLRPAQQIVQQMQAARIIRATYSENQLQEQMVDFWLNHFNVYAGKSAVKWYIPSYERDVIRKNALGSFKDLLAGTAQHPAMLFYLDNFQSQTPNAQNGSRGNAMLERIARNGGEIPPRMRENMRSRGLTDEQIDQRLARLKQTATNQKKNQRGINENYARELMELHTLGVDGGYTQQDIIEVAKAFTGWTIADPQGYRKAAANEIQGKDNVRLARLQRQGGVPDDIESGEFYFNDRWHETGAKTVLGQKVDEGGMKDGLKVLDILVAQPATAKFIARKLAVKFVSDNPSDALVNRIADAFHKSNGDIKTTLRAMFTSAEFYAPETYRAKIKTPFELMVSSLRALNADVKTSPALISLLNKMGEPLYGYIAPTGYPDKAEDWVSTGALLERMNFAVALASNRIPQAKVNLTNFAAASPPEILNKAVGELLDGEIAPATRAMLGKQMQQPLTEPKLTTKAEDEPAEMPAMRVGNGGGRRGMGAQARLLAPSGDPQIFKVVGLLLGSPDFQRQ